MAVGHYARLQSMPCVIYEAADRWGGNCVTYEWNGFRYDSGAHRLHGTDPDIVRQCAGLVKGDLSEVNIPSRIFKNGHQFKFPLELTDIVRNMPFRDLLVGMTELLRSAIAEGEGKDNFEELAIRRYGRFFAKEFLLDYTEKLWGRPCSVLDTSLTGKRLNGLNAMGLLKDMLKFNSAPRHMEGKFYYPQGGIGRLTDALADSCGRDRIRLNASVTRIFHDTNRIFAIEINHREQIEVDEVVSTLPVNRFLGMLEPAIAGEDLITSFYFRNLMLVAMFLDKGKIGGAASLYFPGRDTVFTRAYEPRNRCISMSPRGTTSLVAEIPCDAAAPVWSMPDQDVSDMVIDSFCGLGWIRRSDILGAEVRRLPDAYPVILSGHRQGCTAAEAALKKITNLRTTGRNGRFAYSWIHDQLRWGQGVAREMEPDARVN